MRYKIFGRSGLRVSEVALGAMTFGSNWGNNADRDTVFQMMDRFAGEGGNFVDTADIYADGMSERILGEYIASDRDHWVVATKFSGGIGVLHPEVARPDVNKAGNHRKNMMRAVEASLERLGTDHIDVYYVHFWDFTTRPDEVMRGLDDLVSAGKILYPALSDTPAWIVAEANTRAEYIGWAPVVAIQVEYSLLERTAEREMFPMARANDLAIVPFSPLAAGLLSGKYSNAGGEPRRLGDRQPTAREQRIIDEVAAIAAEHGRSSAEVALAWVRGRTAWGPLVPLLGARTFEQLDANLGALDLALDADQTLRLDTVSSIHYGVPMEMLLRGNPRRLATAGYADQLDSHRALHAPDPGPPT